MNVLSDFEIRVNAAVRSRVDDDVARLSKIIKEKDEQLEKLENRLSAQKKPVATKKSTAAKKPAATKKSTTVKTTAPSKKGPTGKKS